MLFPFNICLKYVDVYINYSVDVEMFFWKICYQRAVAETYRAMSSSPRSPHIGPVVMSELARRRTQAKPSGPTEV